MALDAHIVVLYEVDIMPVPVIVDDSSERSDVEGAAPSGFLRPILQDAFDLLPQNPVDFGIALHECRIRLADGCGIRISPHGLAEYLYRILGEAGEQIGQVLFQTLAALPRNVLASLDSTHMAVENDAQQQF